MIQTIHYLKTLILYLLFFFFSPLLLTQGIWLKKKVLRLHPPIDHPEGVFNGKNQELKILGLGESTMAGVGISKHTETLTGLTASRMSQLMNRTLHWKILAESGIKIAEMNELIKRQSFLEADVILIAIGGNDIFKLTPSWKWELSIKHCVSLIQEKSQHPLIIFSTVPPVGHFPAIPHPLKLVYGLWANLLQDSMNRILNSDLEAYLLIEDFPKSRAFFLEDGVHPSPLAYRLWAEALARQSIKLLQTENVSSA